MKKQVKTNYKAGGMMLLIAILILLFPTVSNASLQSRPGVSSLASRTPSEFFLLCRQMETSSGPMGLNATIEIQNDKVVETSSSNGIDVHMIKNTEYGTAAMLAASVYGDCPKGYSSASTTQNQSGIMQMGSGYEYVAGIRDMSSNPFEDVKYIYTADARYKNVYKSDVAADSYIPGDATYETQNWKGANKAEFVWMYKAFVRSDNSVFGYSASGYILSSSKESLQSSRAAVVSCAGL